MAAIFNHNVHLFYQLEKKRTHGFMIMKPIITIEYCPKCNWLLQVTYMIQELLTTFVDDIKAVQ